MTIRSTKAILRLALALGSVLAVVAVRSASASAPEFTGTWLGSTDVPDVGSVQVTLVVKKTDAGYSAAISDSALIIAQDTEARDLKVDGDTMSFWFPLASGETVSTQLTIAGDTLSGGWQHESGQTGSLRFERKK